MFKNDKTNIVLSGYMGTGKTSVGKALAKYLKMEFVDLDQEIEKRESSTIPEIFKNQGEDYFRQIEKEVVAEHANDTFTIVSSGGGAVLDTTNITALQQNGTIVTMEASPETILERISHTSHRPILNVSDPLSEIKKGLEKREQYYSICDFRVVTDNKNIEDIVLEIVNLTKIDE